MNGLVRSERLDRQMHIKEEKSEYIFGSQCRYIGVGISIIIVKFRCSPKSMMSVIGCLKCLKCSVYKAHVGHAKQKWKSKGFTSTLFC